jgi:tetratricopeptide (TPR) repeat protein
LLRESITLERERLDPKYPFVSNDLFRLADVLDREGKPGDAESALRECLDLRRKLLAPDHPAIDEALTALGSVLCEQGKDTNAAPVYRERLEHRRKRFGDNHNRVAEAVADLAEVLTATHNESEFARLAGEFPRARVARSEYSAGHGHWLDALASGSKYLELQADDHEGYHLVAPLLVQTGDRQAYEKLCQTITHKFAGATDPYTADRMAKDCLILPRPDAVLTVPAELANTAVTRGRGDAGALPFFQCCKALAEFRVGHYEEAVKWADLAAKGPLPHSQAEAAAIMAMAQFKLNQSENARTALARCNGIIEEKLPKPDKEELGTDWRDWIIAHALQSEAKQVIESERPPSASPANPQEQSVRRRLPSSQPAQLSFFRSTWLLQGQISLLYP